MLGAARETHTPAGSVCGCLFTEGNSNRRSRPGGKLHRTEDPASGGGLAVAHGAAQAQVCGARGGLGLLDGHFGLAASLALAELADGFLRLPGGLAVAQVAHGLLGPARRLAVPQVPDGFLRLPGGLALPEVPDGLLGPASGVARPDVAERGFGPACGLAAAQVPEVATRSSAPGWSPRRPGDPVARTSTPSRSDRRHQIVELPRKLPHRGIPSHP